MTEAPSRRLVLVSAVDAALHIERAYHVTIRPATIRQWAARCRIGRHNKPGGKQTYIDLAEVVTYAASRGLIQPR